MLVVAALAGCGGGGSKTKVLEPTDPQYSNLYVSISAPSEVTDYIAKWALGASSSLIVVDKPQGPRVCSYRSKLTDAAIHYRTPAAQAARLGKYVGKSITLALYGTNPEIAAACKALSRGLSRSH
jgi:hypothetical protein